VSILRTSEPERVRIDEFVALIEARADVVHALIEFLESLHDTDRRAVERRGDDLEHAVERAVEEWRESPHGRPAGRHA
jgi:hypothetical protein